MGSLLLSTTSPSFSTSSLGLLMIPDFLQFLRFIDIDFTILTFSPISLHLASFKDGSYHRYKVSTPRCPKITNTNPDPTSLEKVCSICMCDSPHCLYFLLIVLRILTKVYHRFQQSTNRNCFKCDIPIMIITETIIFIPFFF